MKTNYEFHSSIRRVEHCDICVIGGSCTGLFAAVRAARLGMRVILLEKNGQLGGVATSGLVGIWHPLFDIECRRRIIGGLTFEMLERLEKQNAVSDFRRREWKHIRLHTDQLCLELDLLATEEPNLALHLHSRYVAPIMAAPGRIEAVAAVDQEGLFAVAANFFIDASGDGALSRDAGVEMWKSAVPQPPTTCCRFAHWDRLGKMDFKALTEKYRAELPDLPCGYYWGMGVPGTELFMFAGTRVSHVDCSTAAGMTETELTARRQLRAVMEMFRREYPDTHPELAALGFLAGIREGLHIHSVERLRGDDLLRGDEPDDVIGHGTYPVDIHHDGSDKIEFFELTGEHRIFESSRLAMQDRWLPEGEILPCYHLPLRCIIPAGTENLLSPGRMIDADRKSFGAVRVMVNLNQYGEAAGVAAALALRQQQTVARISPAELRETLNSGGSMI